jgi:hypothetical protein
MIISAHGKSRRHIGEKSFEQRRARRQAQRERVIAPRKPEQREPRRGSRREQPAHDRRSQSGSRACREQGLERNSRSAGLKCHRDQS